jgi:hypothetical protein
LLDDKLQASVADFGLAKILEKCEKGHETMSGVAGSYGYIAPGKPNKSFFLYSVLNLLTLLMHINIPLEYKA